MHQKLCANCSMLFKQKFLIFQFIKLASSFNTFHTKLSKEKRAKKVFCCKINHSRVLFSFPSCDWLYFCQSWHILNNKSTGPNSQQHRMPGMPCWFAASVNAFGTKQWLFAVKMYFYFRENILMHLSRYEKSIAC